MASCWPATDHRDRHRTKHPLRATALIPAAEREAGRRHAAKIRLEVSVANTAARRLYQRNGYTVATQDPRRVDEIIHIRTGPIEVHDVLLSMQKQLDQYVPIAITR